MTEHLVNEIDFVLPFITAGKSTFTIQNEQTGNRFTFRVRQAKDDRGERKPWWFVSLLTGSNNDSDYSYMGSLDENKVFKLTRKSKVKDDTPSVQAFKWLVSMAFHKKPFPPNVKFFRSNHCGRCGRTLTTPESVSAGYGPECIQFVS